MLAQTPEYKRRQLKLAEPGNDSHIISLTLWGQQAVPEAVQAVLDHMSAVQQ